MKVTVTSPLGGVQSKTLTMSRGKIAAKINGFLRPHFVLVRSDSAPKSGSLIAFHIDQITKAIVIKTTFN